MKDTFVGQRVATDLDAQVLKVRKGSPRPVLTFTASCCGVSPWVSQDSIRLWGSVAVPGFAIARFAASWR